ncbi:MAG: hypothetical protein J2P18_05970 [Nocardia sp.]|nr:hypothetical protein [Nocardia sp.]
MLLIPVVVLVGGCKSSSTNAANGGADQSIPADPAGTAQDAQAEDTSCPTSNTTAFAKTKFVAHSGLAFGAFHRWLYKPYKAGTFKKGAKGRITGFIKGGLAALFVKREVRLALADAKANPTLCKSISAPLGKLGDSVQGAFDKLKGGDGSQMDSLNSTITQAENSSKADGVEIKEDENGDLSKAPS